MRASVSRSIPVAVVAVLLHAMAQAAIAVELAEAPRRNVILFLGDGMGVSTVTAARILAGQQAGGSGEEHALAFESFPNVALVKTYNTDAQVPDSAGTMTAIMTGDKTRIGYINVATTVPRDDCQAALAQALPTLLQRAAAAGFEAGIVTTTRITHATPAATFAHSPNRDWESDANMPAEAVAQGCRDIARQLIEAPYADSLRVVLGGGRQAFMPAEQTDPEYPDVRGRRSDGRDLIAEWLGADPQRRYVWNSAQLEALPGTPGAPVLGLFEPSHMQYEVDRAADTGGEPSLADMTRFAIERLQGSARGYFLMVEGGRIDHGHHAGNAHRALTDTIAFSDAVAAAVALVDTAETLIIVTADHSHTLTISGYPRRGNAILGTVVGPDDAPILDLEGRPYTTLSYANGPGHRALEDLSEVDTTARDYRQVAAVPLYSETHAGEDVPAYAIGPEAERVRGVMEQNALYPIMRDALGLSASE